MSKSKYVKVFNKYCSSKKAIGALCEFEFSKFVKDDQKFHSGCWVFCEKTTPTKKNFFFYKKPNIALCKNLIKKRSNVYYYIYIKESKDFKVFKFNGSKFNEVDPDVEFKYWKKGNAKPYNTKHPPLKEHLDRAHDYDIEDLKEFSAKHIFLYDYMRLKLRLIFSCHDIDAFFIDGDNICMLELREKYRSSDGRFGLDLIKISVMNFFDKSFLIIREVEKGTRDFICWNTASIEEITLNQEWITTSGSTGSFSVKSSNTVLISDDAFTKINKKDDLVEKINL